MNETEKKLESLFVNIFGEAVVKKVETAWCPTHGKMPVTDKQRCVACGSPAFTNGADYNAYINS